MNFSGINYTNTVDSFKNYTSKTFVSSIPSQTISVGGYVVSSATTTLDNSNSISQVQVNYGGLESFYRAINGVPTVNLSTYQVSSFYYFNETTLTVYTIVANQSGSSVTIPTITINCRAFLFLSPL